MVRWFGARDSDSALGRLELRTTELPSYRTTEPPSTEPPNYRTTEPPNYRTTELPKGDTMSTSLPLSGRVAVVAGATRGAGRGIARALGEAGAVVYCTGRSVHGAPSAYNRPETIEETAEMVEAAGGAGVAVRVDHTVEAEVESLFCARRARARAPRHRRRQRRWRGPVARPLGRVLADRFEQRRRRPSSGDSVSPDHGQVRRAAHDQEAPRSHRRSDGGRHDLRRRGQRPFRRREELAQGLCGTHGGRAANSPRRGCVDHAGISALGIDARTLRRD